MVLGIHLVATWPLWRDFPLRPINIIFFLKCCVAIGHISLYKLNALALVIQLVFLTLDQFRANS